VIGFTLELSSVTVAAIAVIDVDAEPEEKPASPDHRAQIVFTPGANVLPEIEAWLLPFTGTTDHPRRDGVLAPGGVQRSWIPASPWFC
jgi:hypothetical protein